MPTETGELTALNDLYAVHRRACAKENVWPSSFDAWLESLARRASPVLEERLSGSKAMRHDLETTAGLWALDHQPVNDPDAFQITHKSLMSHESNRTSKE